MTKTRVFPEFPVANDILEVHVHLQVHKLFVNQINVHINGKITMAFSVSVSGSSPKNYATVMFRISGLYMGYVVKIPFHKICIYRQGWHQEFPEAETKG